MEDSNACRLQVGLSNEPQVRTASDVQHLYDMLVDSYECLVAHGVDIPAPPTKDAFVEQSLAAGDEAVDVDASWHPHISSELLERPQAEYEALVRTCPEPW